jgi:hypothetical protein
MIYYVSGKFGLRRGVAVGSITLHPSGVPYGPQPGLAEKSIGTHETHELAVMCDTLYEEPGGGANDGRRRSGRRHLILLRDCAVVT